MSMSYRPGWLKFIYTTVIWPAEALFAALLFGLLAIVPVPLASFVMGRLFSLIGPFTPWHKRAEDQMKLALPDSLPEQRRLWLSQMWDNLGRTAGEFMQTRQMLDKGYIRFDGLHHLDGHEGGFVIAAHLGNWEATSMLGPCKGVRTGIIYRPLNNPYASLLLKRRARSAEADIYEKGRQAAMGMIATVRKGGFMLLLADQQLREGLSVPFFGYPAQTAVAHIKLAAKTGKPLFMARVVRQRGCHTQVSLSAPVFVPTTADDEACRHIAADINQIYESWITDHPGQWLWPHRRWGKELPERVSE